MANKTHLCYNIEIDNFHYEEKKKKMSDNYYKDYYNINIHKCNLETLLAAANAVWKTYSSDPNARISFYIHLVETDSNGKDTPKMFANILDCDIKRTADEIIITDDDIEQARVRYLEQTRKASEEIHD